MAKDLAELSDDALDTLAMKVTAERAKAEEEFKTQQKVIAAEQDRRRVKAQIAELDPALVAAIKAGEE